MHSPRHHHSLVRANNWVEGISFDPPRIDSIRNMASPLPWRWTATVCLRNEMYACWNSIVFLHNTSSVWPTRKGMYPSRRTNSPGCRTWPLKSCWLAWRSRKAFQQFKRPLENQVTLEHVDPIKPRCVYTDASDYIWSCIVAQITVTYALLPFAETIWTTRIHIRSFYQLGIAVVYNQNKAFALMDTTERMHWLLASGRPLDLYTDHNKLRFFVRPKVLYRWYRTDHLS